MQHRSGTVRHRGQRTDCEAGREQALLVGLGAPATRKTPSCTRSQRPKLDPTLDRRGSEPTIKRLAPGHERVLARCDFDDAVLIHGAPDTPGPRRRRAPQPRLFGTLNVRIGCSACQEAKGGCRSVLWVWWMRTVALRLGAGCSSGFSGSVRSGWPRGRRSKGGSSATSGRSSPSTQPGSSRCSRSGASASTASRRTCPTRAAPTTASTFVASSIASSTSRSTSCTRCRRLGSSATSSASPAGVSPTSSGAACG